MAGRPQQFDESTLVRHTTPWRKKVDRAAKKLKLSRAGLIRRATEEWLAEQPHSAKSLSRQR